MENLILRQDTAWIDRIFGSRAARCGGVVRRSIKWVDREIGRGTLVAEVRRRGFHMVEAGGQFVIFCNSGHSKLVC
jgi:hypothetical protein